MILRDERTAARAPARQARTAAAVGLAAFACILAPPPPSAAQGMRGPPAKMMTIPLQEPLFWDPTLAQGDYAIVEQERGFYLLRPRTGQLIARMQLSPKGTARPLERDPVGPPQPEGGLEPTPGWPFLPGDEVASTPLLSDIDRDGSPEVVFVTRSGWVWVLGGQGLPLAGWPVELRAECVAGPALADLDRSGRLEILIGDGLGRVHAMRLDGTRLPGWPVSIPGRPAMPAIHGAVVAADIDGDGTVEVVVAQAEGRICVLDADGKVRPGWPVATADAEEPPNAGTIFARPAVCDLDGDGRLEIIAAANNYRVHVWDATGRPVRGWPRLLDNHGRAGYAEPVVADLDGDGRCEILVATDRGFRGPARVYALDAAGRNAKGWPVDLPERCNAGVAIGDIEGDGSVEVVAATIGEPAFVVAWDHRGRPLPGFPLRLAGVAVNASPILADIDGDRSTDILLAGSATRFEPAVVLLGLTARGRPVARFPMLLEGREMTRGGACVGDLDGDGLLDLLFGTEVQGQLLALRLNGPSDPRYVTWSRPGFDVGNTGCYQPPKGTSEVGTPRIAEPERPEIEGPPFSTPFSPLVSISFVLLAEGHAHLSIHTVQGELVRNLLSTRLPTGAYTISWDGTNNSGRLSPPGVYIYQLETPGRRAAGQLLLLR